MAGILGIEARIEVKRHPLQAARIGIDDVFVQAIVEIDKGGVRQGGQREGEEADVGQRPSGAAREGAHWADFIEERVTRYLRGGGEVFAEEA